MSIYGTALDAYQRQSRELKAEDCAQGQCLKAAVDAVIEECAKIMCIWCGADDPVILRNGHWNHTIPQGERAVLHPCNADAIRGMKR